VTRPVDTLSLTGLIYAMGTLHQDAYGTDTADKTKVVKIPMVPPGGALRWAAFRHVAGTSTWNPATVLRNPSQTKLDPILVPGLVCKIRRA
jgi:hypothetical protein